MAKSSAKTPNAYLYDMLEAARLIRGYMDGVSFDDFWHNNEKRDAVALASSWEKLRLLKNRVGNALYAALPGVPFKSIRGMRNRIAHDYGAVDFKIVWSVTQTEIEPLITALEGYFKSKPWRAVRISPPWSRDLPVPTALRL